MEINSIQNYSTNFNGKINVYNSAFYKYELIDTQDIKEIRRYQGGDKAIIYTKFGSTTITGKDTYQNVILAYTAAKDGSEPKNVIIDA